MISQEEKSKKVLLAEEKLAQAKAQLNVSSPSPQKVKNSTPMV